MKIDVRKAPLSEMRLLRLPQLQAIVPLSTRRIYELEAEGRFPRRVALGDNLVAWSEAEVREWLAHRIEHGRTAPQGLRAAQPPAPPAKRSKKRRA